MASAALWVVWVSGAAADPTPAHAPVEPVAEKPAVEPGVRAPTEAAPGGTNEIGLSPGPKRPHSLPLNNPAVVPADRADHMRADDLVVGVVVAGRARAYPWWILRNYHVSNDTVVIDEDWFGGRDLGDTDFWEPFVRDRRSGRGESYIPIYLALCEACSGAAAFVPGVDGSVDRPLVFAQCRSRGRPGNDYNAVGVYTVCDLQTHSRWHPFTGRAESGPLKGRRMKRVPVQMELWKTWVANHPDTVVLFAGDEMRRRTHSAAFENEMGSEPIHGTYFEWKRANPGEVDERLDPNDLVLGVAAEDGSASLAYPLERLRDDGGFVQLEFRGEPYLFTLAGRYRGLVFRRRLGSQTLDFVRTAADPLRFEDASGSVWNELGEAVSGPHAGRRLALADDSYLAEWVDWSMAHRNNEIYPPSEP